MFSSAASHQEGPEFDSTTCLGPFGVEFTCSPRVCVGTLWVLQLPPTVQRHAVSGVRLTANSKLCIGMNPSVNGGLSLCVSPTLGW